MNQQHSPPLPNLHALSISPYPGQSQDYTHRYSGVFGPPVHAHVPAHAPQPPTQGWGSPNKRGSRSGLPPKWYDPPSRDSPLPHFDPYRGGASSPALSPPTSTSSGPTTASSNPYQSYQPGAYVDPGYMNVGVPIGVGVTPSPPPQLGFTLNSATSAQLSGFGAGGLPGYGSQPLPSLQQRTNGMWRNGYAAPMMPTPNDDVIPTAIVIKNIPFAVSRETLLGVIESLGAPLPYAFNYHHDNGIFRGLAFANFRAPEEAASVVAALNGYDVQGRKLRVEYKKVLQPGEKDKIEREKALKRMRSIQFDQKETAPIPPPLSLPVNRSADGRLSADNTEHSPPHSASSAASDNLPITLDLNDPTALDIYSRVLVFKEDRMRDELAFSRNLTPTERRIVHLVAQKLGLTSITKLEGDLKCVVVTRDAAPPRPTLTTSNSATVPTSSAYLSPYPSASNELSPSLRIKKSMPDLRGFNGPVVARDPTRSLTPQRSSGNLREGREYVSMGASAGRRAHGMNGHGLGSGTFNNYFGSTVGGSDIPPVPPLPSGLGLHARGNSVNVLTNGSSTSSPDAGADAHGANGQSTLPLRNPRGPAGESRGFGGALRTSASGILRGANANLAGNGSAALGGLGRRLSEEDEEEFGEVEALRTRESLEL